MRELDHSFTHVICHWLNQHLMPTVACWWDITLLHKDPFLFLQVTFEWNHLVNKSGKQLLSDKWQACGGSAGPAASLSTLVVLVLSFPPCVTRDGCGALSSPVPTLIAHPCTARLVCRVTVQFVLLVMSQNRTSVRCHSRLYVASTCDITEGIMKAVPSRGTFF